MTSKITILILIAILIALWILLNPRDEFGFSFFGLTTYNAVPIPYFDLKIYPDGVVKLREGKNHFISLNETTDIFNISLSLLEKTNSSIDALIIASGYDDLVSVDEAILNNSFFPVYVMPTPNALKKFNEMKKQGKKVAAIVHSTC
ncbi:MAG: hypothetical protein QXY62_03415 [Candidatus Altiarchaeota archaeon]